MSMGRRSPSRRAGLAVEPDDLVLAAEDDDAVGQRRGGTPQLAEDLHQPLLVELLAPMQPHDLSDDVAPDPADDGRIELRAQPQPAVQSIEVAAAASLDTDTRLAAPTATEAV